MKCCKQDHGRHAEVACCSLGDFGICNKPFEQWQAIHQVISGVMFSLQRLGIPWHMEDLFEGTVPVCFASFSKLPPFAYPQQQIDRARSF